MNPKKSLVLFIVLLVAVQISIAQSTKSTHDMMDMKKSAQDNLIMIDQERLQAIGITSEPVKSQWIEKTIRTVGHVEADERLIAHIHVRFDGWIEKLFVNFTGEKVKKGEALFTVYSPELVSTQQEFLLALQAKNILGKDPHSKAGEGAAGAFYAARQKLLLMGISEQEIKNLLKTEKVSKTLAIDSPIDGTVINKTAVAGMRIEPN